MARKKKQDRAMRTLNSQEVTNYTYEQVRKLVCCTYLYVSSFVSEKLLGAPVRAKKMQVETMDLV